MEARSSRAARIAWLTSVFVLAACSDAPRSTTMSAPREVQVAAVAPHVHAQTSERFALRIPGAAPTAPSSNADSQSGLTWVTPEGWSEQPATAMRVANFRVAGNPSAECYLTLLAGDAGGLAANVNRWCTQISQPAMSADAIDKLTRCELLGREAVLLDLSGTWNGMSGADRVENRRLVGALLVQPQGSAFLKMIGPADVLEGELEHFKALARSIRSTGE